MDEITPNLVPVQTIKAIETHYAGHRFRSRLEARWAVFFDHLEIEWQYEPEGFELSTGVRYLPDFYLPKADLWVEVKAVMSHKDLMKVLRATVELPVHRRLTLEPRLIVLGNLPRPSDGDPTPAPMHSLLSVFDEDYVVWGEGFLSQSRIVLPIGAPRGWFPSWFESGLNESSSAKYRDAMVQASDGSISASKPLLSAYAAARMARFEHGESGAPKALDPTPKLPKPRRKRPAASLTRSPLQSVALSNKALRAAWPDLREALYESHPEARQQLTFVDEVGFRYGKITIYTFGEADDILNAKWFGLLQEKFRAATEPKASLTCLTRALPVA